MLPTCAAQRYQLVLSRRTVRRVCEMGRREAAVRVDLARIGTPHPAHPSQLNTTQTAIDGLDLLAMADYACAETLGRVGRSELS